MLTSCISDEKHESSLVSTNVLLSIVFTDFQNATRCSPASSVSSSTCPNVVRIPVCPVGTIVTLPKIIPVTIQPTAKPMHADILISFSFIIIAATMPIIANTINTTIPIIIFSPLISFLIFVLILVLSSVLIFYLLLHRD